MKIEMKWNEIHTHKNHTTNSINELPNKLWKYVNMQINKAHWSHHKNRKRKKSVGFIIVLQLNI